jgi:hypothetical protein
LRRRLFSCLVMRLLIPLVRLLVWMVDGMCNWEGERVYLLQQWKVKSRLQSLAFIIKEKPLAK